MDDLDDLTDFEIWDRWIATPEGKAQQKIEDALDDLASDPDVVASPLCLQFVRLCKSISPAGNIEAETVLDLTKTIKAFYQSKKASDAAKLRHAGDPIQAAKVNVEHCWKTWRNNPDEYESKEDFARYMMERFPVLKKIRTITGWCRVWERKLKKS